MRTTVVLNAKGGSGKTTLVTNLAGYFASQGKAVVLQDYDPQASSMEWLAERSFQVNQIHGQEQYRAGSQYLTRAWQFRLPTHTEHVLVDTPANFNLQKHSSMIRKADKIIVPVSPSAIEVRSTLLFLKDLQFFFKMNACKADFGVVANKVDTNSQSFRLMQQKFRAEGIEFITTLSQHENYYVAAESGVSIFEVNHPMLAKDKLEWAPLISWIEDKPVEAEASKTNLYAVVD